MLNHHNVYIRYLTILYVNHNLIKLKNSEIQIWEDKTFIEYLLHATVLGSFYICATQVCTHTISFNLHASPAFTGPVLFHSTCLPQGFPTMNILFREGPILPTHTHTPAWTCSCTLTHVVQFKRYLLKQVPRKIVQAYRRLYPLSKRAINLSWETK